MQVFRELTVHGNPRQIAEFAKQLRDSIGEDWQRDEAAEAHMRSAASVHARTVLCFTCSESEKRSAATIFLLDKDPETLYVANIVPTARSLTYSEYNLILEEFVDRFVAPIASKTGLTVEFTDSQADLDRWLSTIAAEKLRDFCRTANKHTGSSHPFDRQRWFDFILAAHHENAALTSSMLDRWLVEIGGWDAELANELAIEYEFARSLLSLADAQKVGA